MKKMSKNELSEFQQQNLEKWKKANRLFSKKLPIKYDIDLSYFKMVNEQQEKNVKMIDKISDFIMENVNIPKNEKTIIKSDLATNLNKLIKKNNSFWNSPSFKLLSSIGGYMVGALVSEKTEDLPPTLSKIKQYALNAIEKVKGI